MEQITVDKVIIRCGNGRVIRCEAVDVADGSGCCGCAFSFGYGSIVVEERIRACDRYACVPISRGDGRRVIFRQVNRVKKGQR